MARFLRRLAFLGLAGLPAALADAGPANVTCVGNASDHVVYTGASGATYQVLCATDYTGDDLSSTTTATFAGCIDACDATPGCVDVSYAGQSCYLKSRIDTPLTRDWVWTAKQITPSPATAANPQLTCVNNKSDKTTYTTTNGAVFQILCGTDYAGGDLAATNTDTFEACIAACSTTAGCIDVSYAGQSCYMKSQLGDAITGRDWVWTAKLVPAIPPPSCDNNANDGQVYHAAGSSFTITCGKDYAGGDLLGLSTSSFDACIQACDSNADCVNVAYVHGACYLKKQQNPAVDNTAVWGAVRIVASATTTTAAASTVASTTASTAATSTASATPLSCDNNASNFVTYTTPKNGVYQVMCGVDYGGGDLLGTTTATFEDCIAACDDNTDCIDVSYVAPSCYLKKTIGDLSKVSYVWTAKQLVAPGSVFAFPTATPMDPGTGTEDSFEGPITLDPAPIATLGPVPPPGVNMAGTGVLTPNPVAELWYNGSQSDSDGSDLGAVTVRLNVTYNYPTIVLDHSIYITDVVCDSASLHGRFNTSYPFYYAQDTWQTNEDVLLITSAATCGADATQNAFFLAHTISFTEASFSFEALGQHVEMRDVFADMTVDFGNITVNAAPEADDACGSPSADSLYGLPAVACGADFDKTLDDKLGYYSAAGGDVQAVLDLAAPTDSTVQRRGFFKSLFKAVAKVVKTVAKVAVAVVAPIVKPLVKAVVAVAKVAVKAVVAVAKVTVALAINSIKMIGFVVTGKYSNSLTLPVTIGPPPAVLVDSPWGKALKMYTFKVGEKDEKFSATKTILDNMVNDLLGEPEPEPGVELYCVNCGVRGSVKATGTINATPLSGIKQASIGVSGNMYVGLYIGLNAFAKWEKSWEKEIFEKGLPGWSIPHIITLGPKITLSGKATIGVEAEGQLLTGASLTWPAFEATLDFAHPDKSTQSGWTPQLDHVFQTHGGVTATAALGLPVSLWFGIDILDGLFKEGVALVDTPAVVGEATLEVNVGTQENSFGNDCAGIAWDIKLTNEVTLEVDKGPTFHLKDWASPALAEGCIGYTPASGSSSTTTSASSPSTTTATTTSQTAVPTVPAGTITCPTYNNQVYTDSNGNRWSIQCNHDYMYYDTQHTWVATMNDCMSWCAAQSNCANVAWQDNVPAGGEQTNCWAHSRAGTPRDGQYHSMTLLSPFEITSVVYGVIDVTTYAITNWQVGNRIEIDTNAIVNHAYAPAQDPLYGTPKSIFILYKYGGESRSWVGHEATGTFTIYPGAISSAPASSMLTPNWPSPNGNNWITIVEVAYGLTQSRDRNVWNRLYTDAWNYGTTPFSNTIFGDSWVGTVKSGVVWYRDTRNGPNGPLYMVAGKEGSFAKLMRPNGSFTKRGLVAPRQAAGDNSTVVLGNNSTLPSNTTTTSDVTPGQGTATVRDTTGAVELFPGTNGNLFVAPVDSPEQLDLLTNGTTLAAAVLDGNTDTPYMVTGDSANRLLHYFPDEVSSLGASRFRLATWDKLPVGARLANLVPIASDSDAGTSMLVAIGTQGEYLFPVVCAIENQNNKVFLVKDTSAVAALEAQDLKYVLTGGVASQCSPLALLATITDVTTDSS